MVRVPRCCAGAVLCACASDVFEICAGSAGVFQEVIVTNTIPTREETEFSELTVLSVSNLLGETIWKIYNQSPVDH